MDPASAHHVSCDVTTRSRAWATKGAAIRGREAPHHIGTDEMPRVAICARKALREIALAHTPSATGAHLYMRVGPPPMRGAAGRAVRGRLLLLRRRELRVEDLHVQVGLHEALAPGVVPRRGRL